MSVTNQPLEKFTRGELVKMVEGKWLARVVKGITHAVEHSFRTDSVLRPVQTRDEIERRFRFCIEGFCIMRRDMGFTVPRIVDELPGYLRHRLDGGKWEPKEDGKAWATDARQAIESGGAPVDLFVDS